MDGNNHGKNKFPLWKKYILPFCEEMDETKKWYRIIIQV